MGITLDRLIRVASEHGRVKIVDSTGKTHLLENGNPNILEMIEKAETFIFAGSTYNRAQFKKVLDRMTAKPGDAEQI